MTDLFWLTKAQICRITPYFPLSHGVPRVDDQRVVSGILHVIRNGLRWCDAPAEYGPHKTLYNRFIRWSRLGVFNRPLILLLSKGQMSDHKGAALMLPSLPQAKELLGDKGYDSNRFRQALINRGIAPCIPSSRSRKVPILYDKALDRQRHRVENMFGKLKDWRRIAMRYDRCAHTFMSAICLAATVLF